MNRCVYISDDPHRTPDAVEYRRLSLKEAATPPTDTLIYFIDAFDHDYALGAARILRQHGLPSVYLRPMIFISPAFSFPENLSRLADETVDFRSFNNYTMQRACDTYSRCLGRIESLPNKDVSHDLNVALRVLRFLYVRDISLHPIRSVQVKHGFEYPAISLLFESEDEKIFNVLEFMAAQGLFNRTFLDNAYFCSNCSCAFLNFREECPNCGSADLLIDDLVHHFPCANVAPLREYLLRNGQHQCPKCDRMLKHIGVDYDKPSVVYSCKECNHSFQDPAISSICYNCGKHAPPDEMHQRAIYDYTLTSLGRSAAIYGMESLFRSILDKSLNTLPLDVFKVLADAEAARVRRYRKSVSSIVVMYIKDLDALQVQLGDKAESLFRELASVIRAELRVSDLISFVNNSLFLSLLVETPLDGAETALSRLRERITTLFRGSIDLPISVRTKSLLVTGEDDTDTLVSTLTEHVSAE